MWGLQWAWSRLIEGTRLRLDSAFLYGWGSLMAVTPPVPITNIFGQVLHENAGSLDAALIMLKNTSYYNCT